MKITKLFMAALVSVTMLASCSQEGPAGPTGPTGADGLPGANGSANVTTTVGTIPTTGWAQAGTSNVFYAQFPITAITNYTTDVVVAYVQGTASSTSDYYALPVTNFIVNNDAISYSYNSTSGGTVTFYYEYTNGTATITPNVALNIKIAVIPPAVIKQHPGLNVNDYKAVMALVKQTKGIN